MAYNWVNGPLPGCNIEYRKALDGILVFEVHVNCPVHPNTWDEEFTRYNVLQPYSEADIRLTEGYYLGVDYAQRSPFVVTHINFNPEEEPVSRFSQTVIDSYKVMMQEQKDKEAAQLLLALVESFGVDDYEETTVLRWQKAFREGEKKYTYAAIKANGNVWYATAQVGKLKGTAATWEDLVLWLISVGESIDADEVEVWYPFASKFDRNHDRPETVATHVAMQKRLAG